MSAWPKLVLFDLDGTLIDSVPDIRLAINELVAMDGLAPFSEAEVRSMVGRGLGKLIERAYTARGVALYASDLAGKLEIMASVYMRHLTGHTTLLPGALEALAPREGQQLALVTNKLQSATEALVGHFGLRESFAMILGDSGIPLKPAPDMLLHIASTLGVGPGDAVMVGDSAADIESARRAGIASVAVEGGYSDLPAAELGADIVIADLHGLKAALAELGARRTG